MRYKEHMHIFRNNCHSSKFAQHLNEIMHTFGPIENIMKIFNYQEKRLKMYIHFIK
jgi:hypothetical protein